MNISLFPAESEAALYEAALEDVHMVISETLSKYDVCRIALAGGGTPEPLYKAMAMADLPWDRLNFTLIDERYVPSDHKESNLRMLRRTLLNTAPLSPDQILTFDTSLPYEECAKEMERRLQSSQAERKPLFDLLILGAGSDGHVASLFNSEDLDASFARTTSAEAYPTRQRISLGLGALSLATQAMLLLRGDSKKGVLESLTTPSQSSPIEVLVQRVPTKVHFYL